MPTHLRDVLDERRDAIVNGDKDIADVVHGREPAETANIIELPAFR